MKKTAFTLSEVLLVLSVIGVVAALTIPTLVQKTSDGHYRSAWKKEFSTLSQVTTLVLLNDQSDLSLDEANNISQYGHFKKYLSYIKDYGSNTSCGALSALVPNYSIKDLSGGSPSNCNLDDGVLGLSDGTILIFNNVPALIFADVNGVKPPNVIGKDVFGVRVYSSFIKPLGYTGDGYENTCSTSGYSCSADYLYK